MLRISYTRFYKDNYGVSAIEFAILLPIFLILCLGVMEFGLYFVKDEIVNNAISTISQTIQRDPTYYQSLTPAQLTQLEKSYGSGLIDFTKPGNYICVDTYSTQAAAAGATACTSTHFNTTNPGATTPYYIAVRGDLPKGGITPLGNFVSGVKNIQVNQSSGIVAIGNLTPPPCTTAGWFLQYNPANATATPPTNPWMRVPFGQNIPDSSGNPTNCTQPWQKMAYNSATKSFTCSNIPFVIASGIANPTSSPSSGADSGSYWDVDRPQVPWIRSSLVPWASASPQQPEQVPVTFDTLCKANVTFQVPTGLPANGTIVTSGNLTYLATDTLAGWHSWVISFVNQKLPSLPGGGTASMDVCESNGGNWVDSTPGVGEEHIAWVVTWMPPSSR